MATYAVSVHDRRTGKKLGSIEGQTSPHACGQAMADAWTVLIFRDGFHLDHLDMQGTVTEEGQTRPFTDAEQAAMVSGLDQRVAEMRQRPGGP